MPLQETGLIEQARIQVQQTAEFARRQKEADQMSRQLFADCVETVDRYGTRRVHQQGADRLFALGFVTPFALLTRSWPSDLLDTRRIARRITTDDTSLEVSIETSVIPRKSSEATIRLEGSDQRLVLNKHRGYGEVHLYNPSTGVSAHQRRAHINDLIGFRQVAESMTNFTKADPVPIPDDVVRFEQLSEEQLRNELQRAQRFSGINSGVSQVGAVALLLGLMYCGSVGQKELVFGSGGLIVVGGLAHSKVGINLDRRAQIIQDEIASRS